MQWVQRGAVLMALLAAPPLHAQVYKCKDADGISYQSHPCTDGPALKQWTVETAPTAAQAQANARRLAAIQREMDARNRVAPAQRRRSVHGPPQPPGQWANIAAQRNPQTCASVKAQRDAAYRAAGHKRSFSLARYWDDRIHDACR